MSIESSTLVQLVENTAPFLFESTALRENMRYIDVLRNAKANPGLFSEKDLIPYYELCIASHFATVATFVPTDVDNAIRQKLWYRVHQQKTVEPMWALIQEFLNWDEALVSVRWVKTDQNQKLSGHQGEWFSIALGAYGSASKVAPELIPEIREAIEALVESHEKTLHHLAKQFLETPTSEKMKSLLGGVAIVAHNLGDLDRMIDAWKLSETDVLKRRVFRMGHEDARSPRKIFFLSGKFYQDHLASENHRHFALREPKPLRKSSQFLLPFGPFFDEWGANLVKRGLNTGLLNEGELREIVEALIEGWKRLNPKSIYTSQGYARALAGVQNAFPHGRKDLEDLLSPALRKDVTEGGIRTHLSMTQKQFEEQWIKKTKQVVGAWIE